MTFQACDIDEARHLYDHLAVMCPIIVRHNVHVHVHIHNIVYHQRGSEVDIWHIVPLSLQRYSYTYTRYDIWVGNPVFLPIPAQQKCYSAGGMHADISYWLMMAASK